MFGLVSKRKLASVLGEMRWRSDKEGYVRREAQNGYLYAITDFERLLGVAGRRRERGLRQVQKGGAGSVQVQVGRDYHDTPDGR